MHERQGPPVTRADLEAAAEKSRTYVEYRAKNPTAPRSIPMNFFHLPVGNLARVQGSAIGLHELVAKSRHGHVYQHSSGVPGQGLSRVKLTGSVTLSCSLRVGFYRRMFRRVQDCSETVVTSERVKLVLVGCPQEVLCR